MSINLDNYVEVHERIAAFTDAHPEGSLQSKWSIKQIGDQTLLVVAAQAFRSPEDPRPGMGLASEPFPGKTPYTRDSELMNAETSAWGRAIAALGFEVKRGIATRGDVEGKQPAQESEKRADSNLANERQRQFIFGEGSEPGFLEKANFDQSQMAAIARWASVEVQGKDGPVRKLAAGPAVFLIDKLKDGSAEGRSAVLSEVGWSDVPGDLSD